MLLRSRYEKCPANGSKNKLKTAPEMSPNGFNNASGTTSHSVPKLAPASRPLDMTFCCYLLHLSKVSHLWKCPILGHILGPISCLKASKSTFRMWSKKGTKKSSQLVFFWHPLGITWGAKCLAFSVQMAGKTCWCPTWPPRASKALFLDAFGILGVPAKRAIAIVFCALIQLHLGLKLLHTLL